MPTTTAPRESMPSPAPSSPSTPDVQPAPSSKPRKGGEMTVEDIIANARKAPVLAGSRGAWILSTITGVLMWASFTPLDWGFLGWWALVPMCLLVRLSKPTRWMYTAVSTCGFLSSLAMLQWMRLGDIMMYPAWVALSFYLGLYFPVFVGLSRTAVHKLGIPMTLAVPVVWVGLEFFRARLMTGFAWYYLGHTQYQFVELIQISDITGAYGVSFVVAMVSACAAGLVSVSVIAKLKMLPPGVDVESVTEPTRKRQALGVAATLLVFASVLTYGIVRRAEAEFVDGPRVALVQGNFPVSVKHDPNEGERIYRMHEWLTGRAVSVGEHPDLIVWPETMYRVPLLEADVNATDAQLRQASPFIPVDAWRNRLVHEALQELCERCGAGLVVGVDTFAVNQNEQRRYNSAAYVLPERGVVSRYDKLHRVPFGEYFPLQDVFPALRAFTPYGSGLDAGDSAKVFQLGSYRVAPVICYEDTVPQLVRGIVQGTMESSPDGKPVDLLVNLTNDGWFHGSSELDQHLITAQFRAVECRTPMVRAVNTGISAFIDGDGVVREPEIFFDGDKREVTTSRDPETGRLKKSLNAMMVAPVPLDSRQSWYVQTGDWFSGTCAVAVVGIFGFGVWTSRRRKNTDDALATIA